jgi:hypothetical protein
MKPAIVFAAAFLVSTGLTTGAKYAMTPAPPLPKTAADSLKAAGDSTKKDTSDTSGGQPPAGETPSELPHTVASPRDTGRSSVASASPPAATALPLATSPTTAPRGASPAPSAPRAAELERAVARAIATETAPKDTATEAAERRVSKVFTSMDPKQAAKVLDHMTDGDIHVILGYVGPRQAAAILAELKPERVAALSKLAMKPNKQ